MSGILKYLKPLQDKNVFSYAVLASIIPGGDNKRHALIKRALSSGDIIQLRRGLYCFSEQQRRSPLSLMDAAQQIYGPSYISFESALAYHGWIPEAVYVLTCAAQGKSKEFKNPLGTFVYRRIAAVLFYEGVEKLPSGVFMAKPLRALLDLLYVQKKSWKSVRDVEQDLRIEAQELLKLNRREIARYKKVYHNSRVLQFMDVLLKEVKK